ncbi:P-loop containing nucleoside triphosphate hydrolase protein [Mrakia frigida]|uniref:DEAD/DEAH box helicase n=1 Tax=Mrakia frigida TaxID=29902 RepID=UPI003FCC0448
MLSRLDDLGVEDLFAVQTGVIPFLLPPAGGNGKVAGGDGLHPRKATRDVCVSAPTGSGKTLAYVVPVVEVLSKRIVTRLRALIILPTRDLVSQVKETFESVAKGTGLKIATVTGSQSFASEQANLVSSLGGRAGSSMVDILICTPGRLIDHLNGTPGFSLEFLRFLIIDEADRLLTQSFQDWLQVVLAKTRSTSSSKVEQGLGGVGVLGGRIGGEAVGFEGELEQVSQCQKLLFSATLTRDPSKIAALKLHDPQYFVIQDESDTNPTEHVEGEAFAVPATLKHFLVVPTSTKPLHLLHLLHSSKFTSISTNRNVLCFTKSVESAARLVQLVKFFEEAYVPLPGEDWKPLVVKAYSSDLGGQGGSGGGGERAKVLREFKEGKVDLLICSDLIARGIDIASVSHVVSYDVPVDMRKYIHRVGRTARAGREGSAWSLVETQEVSPTATFFSFSSFRPFAFLD